MLCVALKRMSWRLPYSACADFFFLQDRLGPKRMQKALKAMEVWERAGYLLAAGAGDAQKMQVHLYQLI